MRRRQVSTLVALIAQPSSRRSSYPAAVGEFAGPLIAVWPWQGSRPTRWPCSWPGLNRDVRLPELLSPGTREFAAGDLCGARRRHRAGGGLARFRYRSRLPSSPQGRAFWPTTTGRPCIRPLRAGRRRGGGDSRSVTPDQLNQGVPLAWTSIIALGLLLSGVAVFVADQAARAGGRPLPRTSQPPRIRLREGDPGHPGSTWRGPAGPSSLARPLNRLAERVGGVAERQRCPRQPASLPRTPACACRPSSLPTMTSPSSWASCRSRSTAW